MTMAMSKHCETFEHTADIGLQARADTQAELYEALAEGLAELFCPRDSVEAKERFELSIPGDDAESLAVDFLAKLLAEMQSRKFAVRTAEVDMVGPNELHAVLAGEPIAPDRHELGAEIKAVTYHMLQVKEQDGRWHGRVLLDL